MTNLDFSTLDVCLINSLLINEIERLEKTIENHKEFRDVSFDENQLNQHKNILNKIKNYVSDIDNLIAVTTEIVQNLYEKFNNKKYFINKFGTKKFHLVSEAVLIDMYNFLNR